MQTLPIEDFLYRRNQDHIFSEIDNEIVILNVESGNYIILNEIGSHIWNILVKPHYYKSLVEKLLAKYDVSAKDCRLDTEEFLITSMENGIIEVVEDNG